MAERKKKIYMNAINKYNKKAYNNVSVRLPKDLVAQFKEKCAADGISQAQVIREAIEAFLAR